jgi:hypothetical protein
MLLILLKGKSNIDQPTFDAPPRATPLPTLLLLVVLVPPLLLLIELEGSLRSTIARNACPNCQYQGTD